MAESTEVPVMSLRLALQFCLERISVFSGGGEIQTESIGPTELKRQI